MDRISELESRIADIENSVKKIESWLATLERLPVEFHDLHEGHVEVDMDCFCTYAAHEMLRLDYRIKRIAEQMAYDKKALPDIWDYGTPESVRAREVEFEKFSKKYSIQRVLDISIPDILCKWGISKPFQAMDSLPRIDHSRVYLNTGGEEVVTYHPYVNLDKPDDLKGIEDGLAPFCKKYGLGFEISRNSWYNPGNTCAVIIYQENYRPSFCPFVEDTRHSSRSTSLKPQDWRVSE